MKLLVLSTDYPDNINKVKLMYVHTRNKYYVKKGLDVTVLNFSAKKNYYLEGVKIITLNDFRKNKDKYKFDILISHAPNLRHHLRFLIKYGSIFQKIIFFFHGHEVLKTSSIYPKPYHFMEDTSVFSKVIRDFYDELKLKIWNVFFNKILYKSHFVFVSNWMYDMFIKFVKLKPELIETRKHIIYNGVGQDFELMSYDSKSEKKYDFITIRNNLDGSKYAIDIVNNIALNNPDKHFCVIGKGEFFRYNHKADNLEWIDKNLRHNEIISFLNISRCGLMPTRADAQGVMACEMATYGIPLITSDLDVCKEVFEGFNNVQFINNEQEKIDVGSIYDEIIRNYSGEKNTKFFAKNTLGKELELINKVIEAS